MRFSEQNDKVVQAMLALQQELGPIVKDRENTFFKSKYATLDSILEYVTPMANKHGLVILQGGAEPYGNYLAVSTMLVHSSGQWVETTVYLPVNPQTKRDGTVENPNAQTGGQVITYGRRYGLCALLALTLEEDDDANAVSGRSSVHVPHERTVVQSIAQKTGHTPPRQQQAAAGPQCPACGSDMWDNRTKKSQGLMSAKAPDFKCKDPACATPIWPGQWPPKKDDGDTQGRPIESYDEKEDNLPF